MANDKTLKEIHQEQLHTMLREFSSLLYEVGVPVEMNLLFNMILSEESNYRFINVDLQMHTEEELKKEAIENFENFKKDLEEIKNKLAG